MTEMELRSMMRGYIQDATQSEVPNITLLNRMMEDIEAYADQKVMDYTTKGVHAYSENVNIKSGPYWDKVKEQKEEL